MKVAMKSVLTVLLTLMLIGGAEVATASSMRGRVAVVDLDAIAKTLGRDKAITNEVGRYLKTKQADINKERDQLKAKLAKEEKKLGKSPKPKQKAEYESMARQSELQLRKDVIDARRGAAQLRAKLINEFTGEVQPVAARLAREKGFGLVLVKQPGMLFIDGSADITAQVTKVLKAKKSHAK